MVTICSPQSLLSGMNRFLASLEVTFRRDPTNFRPRVNKLNSVKDREQKGASASASASAFLTNAHQPPQTPATTSSSRTKALLPPGRIGTRRAHKNGQEST